MFVVIVDEKELRNQIFQVLNSQSIQLGRALRMHPTPFRVELVLACTEIICTCEAWIHPDMWPEPAWFGFDDRFEFGSSGRTTVNEDCEEFDYSFRHKLPGEHVYEELPDENSLMYCYILLGLLSTATILVLLAALLVRRRLARQSQVTHVETGQPWFSRLSDQFPLAHEVM